MLRDTLRDADIPGRTTIWKRIDEMFEDHLVTLSADMQVRCHT